MKVLLIEDEKKTATFLKKGLTENGFSVEIAQDGHTGIHLAQTKSYDLVILDIMLPGRDGWSVISEMRSTGKQTLALFLTARNGLDDRVKGLDLGADGYLTKPFAFSELMAQIRSLLRRNSYRQSDTLKFLDLELDLVNHKANRGDKKLDLTPKEFLLLSLFVRRSGEILSRDLISEKIWDMNFDSDTNVVEVHIRRLRSKVDDPFPEKLIHTIRGLGYIFKREQDLNSQ